MTETDRLEKERKATFVVEVRYWGKAGHEEALLKAVTKEMRLQFGGERVTVKRKPKTRASRTAVKKVQEDNRVHQDKT